MANEISLSDKKMSNITNKSFNAYLRRPTFKARYHAGYILIEIFLTLSFVGSTGIHYTILLIT